VVAVLTLALAIGANAVVFGILNALIVRPLNVPRAQSLWECFTARIAPASTPVTYLTRRISTCATATVASTVWLRLTFRWQAWTPGRIHRARGAWRVSGNYFDALSVQPYLGRLFHASDEHGANSAPYVVLSYGFWHSHFQDDRGVLGRTIRLNKHPFTVIGVTPREFNGTMLFFFPEFFVPLVNQEQLDGANILNARGQAWIS